jgi:hypothetical protein
MGFLLSCCKPRANAKESERQDQVLMEKSRKKRISNPPLPQHRSNGRVIELVEAVRSPFQSPDDISSPVEPSVLRFFGGTGPASEEERLIVHPDTEDESGVPGEMDSSDDA